MSFDNFRNGRSRPTFGSIVFVMQYVIHISHACATVWHKTDWLFCRLQWDWLEVLVHTQDVLKCITMIPGEQFVMMVSMTQMHVLFAALLDTGTFLLPCDCECIRTVFYRNLSVCASVCLSVCLSVRPSVSPSNAWHNVCKNSQNYQ